VHQYSFKKTLYFREPVDYSKYPDYDRVVSTPMNLTTIREDLRGDNYKTPLDFCDDVRRVFNNAQTYFQLYPDEKVCSLYNNDLVKIITYLKS